MRPKKAKQIFLGQPTWNEGEFPKFGLKKANLATLLGYGRKRDFQ